MQRDADLRRPHDQHPADPALTPAPIRQGEPMKITDIRFGMLRVPLKTPFKTALRTVETVEDIVVSIHTDTGHVGYGEAPATAVITGDTHGSRSEEHTSELQSLMRLSYAVFCLKNKKTT